MRHHYENLRTPWLNNRDKEGLHEKVKKSDYSLTVTSFPQVSTESHSESPSRTTVSLVKQKRARVETSRFLSMMGHFLGDPLESHFTKITEESVELEHWVQINMEKGDGTSSHQQSVLGRPCSCLQCHPNRDPGP